MSEANPADRKSATTPTISRHSTSPGFGGARKNPKRSRLPMAKRLPIGSSRPVAARGRLVDDGDERAVGAIVFRQRSTTAHTALNIVVVAPMPSASVATISSEKPGVRRRLRHAYRRSMIPRCPYSAASTIERVIFSRTSARRAFGRAVSRVARRCATIPFKGASANSADLSAIGGRPWEGESHDEVDVFHDDPGP